MVLLFHCVADDYHLHILSIPNIVKLVTDLYCVPENGELSDHTDLPLGPPACQFLSSAS